MRSPGTAILVALIVLAYASAAAAEWVVDADGTCVKQWSSSDLLRGPTAIVNGPILPLRTFAGGAAYAWNTQEWWPWQIAFLGPAVTVISGAAGAVEGVWWIGTGLIDTLTGGAFDVAPESATHLSARPVVSRLIADAPEPAVDPCGRPEKAAATP